ncbi:MAG: hypothetical protein KJZ83_20935 [Burkholderiaceae bacterium]|nr:hypothetical protein [Burkholderiaceae bacterium]
MRRNQLNVHVTPEIAGMTNAGRIEFAKSLDTVPTRSDVVRFALEAYLGMKVDGLASDTEKRPNTSRPRTHA